MFDLTFLLPAFLVAIISSFNFYFEDFKTGVTNWIKNWFWVFCIFFLLNLVIFWMATPSVTSPYLTYFSYILLFLVINITILSFRSYDGYDVEMSKVKTGIICLIIFILLFSGAGCSSCSVFRHSDYRNLIGSVSESNWTKDFSPIDEAHIRIVSREQAQYLANKVLGDAKEKALGSKYEVGSVDICSVNGELLWVAPLEFRGFWKWNSFGHTPGYVIVSAEDNTRRPLLIDSLKLKYVQSAYWSDNLERHVYTNGYNNYQLREMTFELDDNYKPYYVISATRPTIGFVGDKTEGVIIVDPQTGKIEWQDVGKTYDWIDRVIPLELAEDYMNNWGKYVQGFWNSLFGQENIIVPTPYTGTGGEGNDDADVWFVSDSNGRNYWYTGMTSISTDDQALTGVMMMDTKTGKTQYFRISGSNEQAVVDAVSQRLGADGQRWKPTQPIPYNIYGELSYIVPVVGKEQQILQKIAIVRASNLTIALGDDKLTALRDYKRLLTSDNTNIVAPTGQSEIKMIFGRVLRKGFELQGDKTVYFLNIDTAPEKLFGVTSSTSPEILVTNINDKIGIEFLDTNEEIVMVNKFDLLGLDLKKSEIQSAYEKKIVQSKDKLSKIDENKKIEREIENLSTEELKELLELKKQKK